MHIIQKMSKGFFLILIICSLIVGSRPAASVRAQDVAPDEPERVVTMTIDFTLYKWWLIRYSNNQAVCTILTESEQLPAFADIEYHCGPTLAREWSRAAPCDHGGDISRCPGFYTHFVGSSQEQREVEFTLPLPQVYVSLQGCELQPPQNTCSSTPSLLFTGEEPLPNEQVIRIQGRIGNEIFSCPGNQCEIPLRLTPRAGLNIEFWVDSSFGDSSEHYTGKVRVMPWGDFMAPEQSAEATPLWYVDVLSSQWRGTRPATCADVWQVFPELKGPSPWLTSPENHSGLASELSYYYLAGMLIKNGMVQAPDCPNGGLQADNTVATECGVDAAMPKIVEWQNTFDDEILRVSQETGVPAQLLKNVFSRESQFWPGIYLKIEEAGFGQMTEKGADVVLLWNPAFFDQFCPLVLSSEYCRQGFGNLSSTLQNMLRGALVSSVNASCIDCPMGINLEAANFSINVFAEALVANCVQVEQIIYNITSQPGGDISSYEDLWRFTLVNYNAGPGCLSDAITLTLRRRQELTWENLSTNLEPVCQLAEEYVNTVSLRPLPTVQPTPWLQSENVVPPEYVPLPSATPTPPSTPEPT